MLANQITHIAFLACKTSYKVSHFTRHKSHLSGFEKKGGGGAWEVSDRSIGALKIFRGARSPIYSVLGALTLFAAEPGALEKFAAKPGVPPY